jgi:hypothetical protein
LKKQLRQYKNYKQIIKIIEKKNKKINKKLIVNLNKNKILAKIS